MPNPKLSEFLPVILALLLAIGVVALIKWAFVPSIHQDSSELSEIWKLEVVVISAVLGAYLFSEILEGMQRILQQGHHTQSQDKPPHAVSPFVLVSSFGASVVIYLAAFAWIKSVVI